MVSRTTGKFTRVDDIRSVLLTGASGQRVAFGAGYGIARLEVGKRVTQIVGQGCNGTCLVPLGDGAPRFVLGLANDVSYGPVRASALLERGTSGAGPIIYDWFRQAMDWYEKAEDLRPAGNDDALLRWNTCARTIMKHDRVRPAAEERAAIALE